MRTAALVSYLCFASAAWADINKVKSGLAELQGQPLVIFDTDLQRCDQNDLPDTSARAIRSSDGEIRLFASHYATRLFSGLRLNALSHSCKVSYASHRSYSYDDLSDYEWVSSVFTLDGRHVTALLHDEYHGNEHDNQCLSKMLTHCWWNAITSVGSVDGGESFGETPLSVARLQYTHSQWVSHPVGYFNPTNIVKLRDYYYFFFHAEEYRKQKFGICVERTRDPSKPMSWRAWNGASFSVDLSRRPSDHLSEVSVCEPLSSVALANISPNGVYYEPAKARFILLGSVLKTISGRQSWTPEYSLSSDLIAWSEIQPIFDDHDEEQLGSIHYPSLIDSTSPDKNYALLGGDLELFFVREVKPPLKRQLLRVRIAWRPR